MALFKVCRQDSFRCLYPQALRTLASICCVEEGVHQLEKVRVQLAGWAGPEVPERVGEWGERPPGGRLARASPLSPSCSQASFMWGCWDLDCGR